MNRSFQESVAVFKVVYKEFIFFESSRIYFRVSLLIVKDAETSSA